MRAKIIDGDIVFAPRKIRREIGGTSYTVLNPTDEMLAEQGWLPVIYTDPPVAPEGYHYEEYYTEQITQSGTVIYQEWELVFDEISEEDAIVRYANEVTGADCADLISAAETMLKRLTEV